MTGSGTSIEHNEAHRLFAVTRERLEFGQVLNFFARKCQTEEGRRRLLQLDLMPQEAQAEHYEELDAWRVYLDEVKPLRLPAIPSQDSFDRAPTLKPFEAHELRVLARVVSFWCQIAEDDALAFFMKGAGDHQGIVALDQRLSRLFDKDGDWSEFISSTYSKLIREWVKVDARLTDSMRGLARKYEPYLNEGIIYERNHRRTLAVKVDFRGRVKGILHDYSASGNTIYVEPEETVSRQNQLRQIESQIREELWRIRVEVSEAILACKSLQHRVCPMLTRIDMMQALVRVAQETRCELVRPNDEARMDLWDARHPFLCEQFAKAREEVLELAEPDQNRMVSFNLALDETLLGLVISGANTGGKTVTLKTTGLLCWMANSGVPVPVSEGSTIPFYNVIIADIGDNQSLSHNLSTFAGHLANIRHILNLGSDHTLILLDELGSGTDPGEGNALAQAIIDEICRRKFHLLVTTHQQILCTMALTHDHLDNGSMAFDPNQLRPTYRFTQGVPGRSHALDIAKNAGLPEHILAAAHQLVDDHQVDIEAAIRNLQQQARDMGKQRQKLRRDELRLHRRIKDAKSEEAKLQRMQEEFKTKSRERLKKEVEKAERELRSTLSKLSGKRTRTAASQFAKTRSQILEPYQEPEKLPDEELPTTGKPLEQWQEGDRVYMRTWRKEGVIEAIDRKKIRVKVGGMTVTANVEDVAHLEPSEAPKGRVFQNLEEADDRALSLELRLLGFRVEDGLMELERTVDRCLRKGTPFLKIIHGHGGGALKAAVRKFLKEHVAADCFEVVLDPENDGTTDLKFVT